MSQLRRIAIKQRSAIPNYDVGNTLRRARGTDRGTGRYGSTRGRIRETLQATYWSGDPALDLEEAHARAAALRERNEDLRGIAE